MLVTVAVFYYALQQIIIFQILEYIYIEVYMKKKLYVYL